MPFQQTLCLHSLLIIQIFSYMAARHWNRGIVFLFNDIIRDEVLFQVPNGLRCHLIDISVTELAKVNVKAPMPLTEATFLDCLDPYFALAQNSDDSMVHGRVMENIFGKFLEVYSVVSEEESKEVMDQVHVGTIAKFLFELGSDVDTQERYRKPLYDMHKTYMKRLKKVGKDVELDVESPDDVEEEGGMETKEENDVDEMEAEEVNALKKRKRKAAKEVEDESNDAAEETVSPAESKKARKKKRKKSKLEVESPRDDNVVEQTPVKEAAVEEQPAEKKAKKKKKKKKRKSSISTDEDSKGEEEVITISFSDQKKAAEDIAKQDGKAPSSKKKKKKKSAKTPDKTVKETELTSEEKRVKFGAETHSKSYKASMKALKTVRHTPNKTPEHGILRTKISTPASTGHSKERSSKKKSRRKATDYF